MNLLESSFYGDNIRWFIARVIDNKDPDKLGRVQVHIRGIHSSKQEEVPQSSLPWASTVLPTTEGGTSGIGKIPQLLPGALVFGIFLDGRTSQLPLVIGHLNQIENPTLQQKRRAALNQTAPNINQGANSGVDGSVVRNSVKNLDVNNPTSYSDVFDPRNQTEATTGQKRLASMIFFVDNGYTPAQAAGIVGNLEAESGFNTTIVSSVSGESSQGLAQWNPAGGRLQELKLFASRNNYDWRNFSVQLQYIIYELNNYAYFGKSRLVKCTKFTGGKDDKNSTWIFMKYYERPQITAKEITKREGFAKTAYDQYNNNISAGAG